MIEYFVWGTVAISCLLFAYSVGLKNGLDIGVEVAADLATRMEQDNTMTAKEHLAAMRKENGR
jgi:hypothetical protein